MYRVYTSTPLNTDMSMVLETDNEQIARVRAIAESADSSTLVTIELYTGGGSTVITKYNESAFSDTPPPVVPIVPASTPEKTYTRWDDFLRKFTLAERVGIRTLAKTDVVIEDYMKLGEATGYVVLQSTETQNGLGYLAMQGLITEARVIEILS